MNRQLEIWTLGALTLVSAVLVSVSVWHLSNSLPGKITVGLIACLSLIYTATSPSETWQLPKRVFAVHFSLTFVPLLILVWSLSLWVQLPPWWEMPALSLIALMSIMVTGICHDHQHDTDSLFMIMGLSFVLLLPYLGLAGYHMHHGTSPTPTALHLTQVIALLSLTLFVANFFFLYYSNQETAFFVTLDPFFGLIPVGLVGMLTSSFQDWPYILAVGLSASSLLVLSNKKTTSPIYESALKPLTTEDIDNLKNDVAHSFWLRCQEKNLPAPDTLKLIWCEHPKLPIQGLMLKAFITGKPALPDYEILCENITEKFPPRITQAHWDKEIELPTGPQSAHQKLKWHQKERQY